MSISPSVRILQLVPETSDLENDSGYEAGIDGSPVDCGGAGGNMMENTMIHYYWSIICKTEECKVRHPVSYVGTRSTFTLKPVRFEILCFECNQSHRYTELDLKLYPCASPLEGFQPIF